MSKVTSKLQVTIPKELADRYRIGPGDEIHWIPAGDEIRVVREGARGAVVASVENRLSLFDRATDRRDRRTVGRAPTAEGEGRGWTREDLYDRGGPR